MTTISADSKIVPCNMPQLSQPAPYTRKYPGVKSRIRYLLSNLFIFSLSALFFVAFSPTGAIADNIFSNGSPDISASAKHKISPQLKKRMIDNIIPGSLRVLILVKQDYSDEGEEKSEEYIFAPPLKTKKIDRFKYRSRGRKEKVIAVIENMKSQQRDRIRKDKAPESRDAPSDEDPIRSYWITNCIAATVTPDEIERIAENPDVTEIVENVILQIPPIDAGESTWEEELDLWNHRVIGLDEIEDTGLSGAGIRVGHLDTGIALDTPELEGKITAWAEFGPLGEKVDSEPHDSHSLGHGTHSASIIAGETVGIAPGVSLLSALVLPDGTGTLEQILAGMQWVLDPDGDPQTDDGAQIVNMSWGMSEKSTILREAIDNMIALGVLPVAAIGNSIISTSCPGNIPGVVGVGAVGEDDLFAPYSSGGTVCWEDFCVLKPDLSAPGNLIWGAQPGGGYRLITGTSAAAPHVTGSAALLLEYSDLDIAHLKNYLFHTSTDLGFPGHDPRYGRGRLDISSALYFLDQYGPRQGAGDLVLEMTRTLFGQLDLSTFYTYFSDGQGNLINQEYSLQIIPDSIEATFRTMGLGDVDGDGFSDLIVSRTLPLDPDEYSTEYWVYRGGEINGFSKTPYVGYSYVSTSPDPYEPIALADVNGDQKEDLVLCEREQTQRMETIKVFALLSSETGRFKESNDNWCTISSFYQFRVEMRVGDINGDGMADLVFSREYESAYNRYPVYYYAGISDGTRFVQPSYWLAVYPSSYPLGAQGALAYITLSDTNADGLADLIFSCNFIGYKGIYVCLSNGVNGFSTGRLWAGIDTDARVEAVVDVDNDGAADLVFSEIDAFSNSTIIYAWLSDHWHEFTRNDNPWFDSGGTGLPSELTLTGVVDVGIGDWQ